MRNVAHRRSHGILVPARRSGKITASFPDVVLVFLAVLVVGSPCAVHSEVIAKRTHPSMLEPVHGSAPDIAGKGIANPVGQIWSGALMLDHLGQSQAAQSVVDAMARVFAEGGPRTPDLGGNATTEAVTRAVMDYM